MCGDSGLCVAKANGGVCVAVAIGEGVERSSGVVWQGSGALAICLVACGRWGEENSVEENSV